MCDVFEHVEYVDPESFLQHHHWYSGLSEKAFLEQYQRFHEQLPDVIVGSSETIDATALAGTCRIVHLDGGFRYEVVRHDASTARDLLGPGGIVAFDGVFTPHQPGVALAVWELVLSGTFVPLCSTERRLYGTWDAGVRRRLVGPDRRMGGRGTRPRARAAHAGRMGGPAPLLARWAAGGHRAPPRAHPGPRGRAGTRDRREPSEAGTRTP